ncbi:DUF4437 domain-containing protein [Pontiella agarivorans]|uniref:DUF4437 domain-containing protein n=1 Tax=Pontiella agarivorans TaxID=3038953 RepID=A0ABU5MXT2_9BACT|nr:DUF4437 domain-containing protein [Pontiella agarivorans]MDZ8118891.1 DUF4437 domain-containing protein [Pontiella agarivorans]
MMKNILTASALLFTAALVAGCNTASPEVAGLQKIRVITADQVDWTHLNPKRGDLAPKAGTLWGDRNGNEPTGFLLKPPSDFESPPHIHNISYRGVVIEGVIHNDDPNAAEMWMPAGSFWTQPKGHVHITAAEGSDSLAYIEIEEGPYLVLPEEDHFDTDERPVNVDETNIVWLNPSDMTWINQSGAQVAFLWGDTEGLNGTFIKLPAGFEGTIKSSGSTFRTVLVKGGIKYENNDLLPGSGIEAFGPTALDVETDNETVLYVRTDARYNIVTDE